ncbi:uncharacterized protein HMPREF1541_07285 [Cyphellophora europaea CBS 101466]|uniref:HECT-type E3 ubiquitin transferase n=1 Tax=Cyphellophora europaea (strain CBS 101466) TaxID=1220924 RepID=W2RME6_CYPE1|nr:uncharacterized protein HMPREF1541_07285 [Cyphellophora europaea CBS 101466]ETN37662.1 hypothetical protein HMPREF1541_07285 [Cyphellophora europaea CBS 101466]
MSQSPAVLEFVKRISAASYSELPALFESWDRRWPYPRGDLMNWVVPLDRFDEILKTFITTYSLEQGPQTASFGVAVLVKGTTGADETQMVEKFGEEGDRILIESILDFSRLLVEKCANRATYNSSDRLNDLLNTTSLSLLHRTLRLTILLAQRYSERGSPVPAPVAKFYDYDHDRLRCLASPIAQNLSPAKRVPASPVKSTKSKAGHVSGSRRTSAAANPNDFRSLCRDFSAQTGSARPAQPDRDWQAWAQVKVAWTPEALAKDTGEQSKPLAQPTAPSTPNTPTPLRRQTSASAKAVQLPDSAQEASDSSSNLRSLEFSTSDLSKMTIEEALRTCPDEMPKTTRYELLHKLRIAYGLLSSHGRKDVLAIRILAINIVGNVFTDDELQRNLLGRDQAGQKPQELVQQLVNLIQDPKKGQPTVEVYMQTLSMVTIGVLARHKLFAQDITAALGASSANGLLLRLTQRALVDLTSDGDENDTLDGDEWREAVFLLPQYVIEASGHHGRLSEGSFSSSFVAAYVTGLRSTTVKAMRVHLRMLDFMKSFFHHFKDGLQVLLQTDAFENLSNLTRDLAEDAWQQHQGGKGIPPEYKTRLTDYEIPYIHRQVLRSIIDMINDITGHQGANADRASRSLVDSQSLLTAFKLIMDKLQAFGTHTWSEVVKAISGFLNNEPTCFTVIAEAGIIKSFLGTVTRRDGSQSDSDIKQTISDVSAQEGPGIPASVEAIGNASQLFEAICLTSAGFDLFKSSGALEKFFEIFESPAHVKLMKDLNNMRVLGTTFDELVRHHPNLRDTVMSSVIVMIARVRHITRAMAGDYGAGPKLWHQGLNGDLKVSGGIEALRQEIIPSPRSDAKPSDAVTLPDGKKLTFDEPGYNGLRCAHPQNEDSHGLTASDYMRPSVGFLSHLFRTQSSCVVFLEHGGADMVLDLVTIPSVPVAEYSFGMHGHMEELANVIHMMAELKPGLVLPALVDRALFVCSELQHFSHSQPGQDESYFDPLIQLTSGESQHSEMDATSPVEQNGTYLVRSLMAIYCLAQVIGEVFSTAIFSSRTHNAFLFGLVNLADLFAELSGMLGDISAACVREAIVIQKKLPDPWVKATKPENFSMGDDEVDQILRIWDSSSNTEGEDESPETTKDRQTAAFKNVQTLRYLTLETPAAIAELLGSIGHGTAGGRRRPDTFSRQKSAMVSDAIAGALLKQLQPDFIQPGLNNAVLDKETRFKYLVVCLSNMRVSLHDDLQGAGTGEFCQSFVVNALKKLGGIRRLRDIGTEFFSELKQCKVEVWTFAANTGLKTCLDIFDILTSAKSVVGAPQSSHMKNSDPGKAHYFVPPQALLEFRMEALPLVREIWDSEYADQASRDVVHKLVSILKHALQGDSEEEAVQTQSGHPKVTPPPPRKFPIDHNRLRELKDDGFDEDLAKEALYRTNTLPSGNSNTAAKEYCRAMIAHPRRRRLPIPSSETDLPATTRETPSTSSPAGASSALPVGPIEAALAEVVNNASHDSEMEGVTSSSPSDPARPQTSGSSAMDLSNILNSSEQPAAQPISKGEKPAHPSYSVEIINAERGSIRDDLAERCNNVLNSHQDMVFELADLISSATKKMSREAAQSYWESTSDLLVNSLLSMQADGEIEESEGKKIAAAAHLIALLINDKEVFKTALGVFQENFEGLLSFLKLSGTVIRKGDDTYPWVAPILLLIEQMLSQDNEPAEVRWDHPRDLESPMPKAELVEKATISLDQKKELFTALLDCLPRVGKDKSMALSIARVLVMLTRKREIATALSEKRNLQRLFLMVKQLGMGVSSRFLSSFMLILRHIVEDEETLVQIMRSEIQAAFTGRNSSRNLDLNGYTRELHHLAIRSPEVFVKVSNDLLKLSQWQPHSPGPPLALKDVLKDDDARPADKTTSPAGDGTAADDANEAAASVENTDAPADDSKGKTADIKPPVVENPDGVIHFLLSELLSYKDVDDKDVPSTARADSEDSSPVLDPPVAPTIAPESPASSIDGSGLAQSDAAKPERPRFKPEDHPIFIYRCFLLQCLVELLHSYSRTKIEFINFSRKSDPLAVTPSKPRSGILNYVLNGLVASGYVDKDDQSIHCKKRLAVSDWAIKVLVSLCSKTGEKGKSAPVQRYALVQVDDKDDEPELTFVRRFVLEHAIKAFKDATSSTESLQTKYSKLLCLSDMFNRLLSKPSASDGAAGSNNTSYRILGRMMFEKNLISVLTSSLAEIDLSQRGARRVIKFILRPLQELTSLATQLSLTSPDVITSVLGNTSDDDISSASSVSEVEDEREETPDLYRNSALGLLDPNRPRESDSDSDDEDDDEEMYDDEEYPDEMDYDDGMPAGQEDDEAVSDEDEDDMDGPIEGLPGDVPMELEFVVNEGGMEVDTGDDDSETSSDDGSDDEDGEDFDIEDEDGEINADNENDSLGDGHDHEADWEDDEGDEDIDDDADDDEGDEIEVDMNGDLLAGGPDEAPALQDDLNNLLRVLNGRDEEGGRANHTHVVMHPGVAGADDEEDHEDVDVVEEDEEMDENDALGHDHFDDFMDGDIEDEYYEDQWTFDEPAPRPRGFGRRNFGGRSIFRPPPPPTAFLHPPSFRGAGESIPSFYRSSSGRRPGRQDNDDGTNPLLQRPPGEAPSSRAGDVSRITLASGRLPGDEDLEEFNNFTSLMPGPVRDAFRSVVQAEGGQSRGHGQLLDLIANTIHRGGPAMYASPMSINVNVPLGELSSGMRHGLGMGGGAISSQRVREDPPRAVSFTPATTMVRWQEERAILFGNQYLDKLQRIQLLLMSMLAPSAQQEEKERLRKREEEIRAQREEEERQRQEAERTRKEREEQEAAERAEEERRVAAEVEAAAAAAAAAADNQPAASGETNEAEPMEGVQSTEPDPRSEDQPDEAESSEAAQERVFTTIRGRQLDITGLAIDREYLEALPEELREEVIMQQYATRREEAQQQNTNASTGAATGTDNAPIDPEYLNDFLNALPEEVREEIRQSEANAQRQREREAARREAAVNRPVQAEDMNNDDFLATLDPALRREILGEQSHDILAQLNPRFAAEGREHARRIFHYSGLPVGRQAQGGRVDRDGQKDNKRQVVQLVDKAGVATLLRLMFLPQQGSLRSNLWHILRNVCGNRLTRFEVINMLLVILKEGSTDVTAVERSLASLSLRAKATAAQKTPQPLKRTLSMQPSAGLGEDVTPLVVVQQCLSALKQLSQHGLHVRTLFLREVDISSSSKSKKGKDKESKTTKYPINDLITLLDRKLIVESAPSLQSLAELLAAVTSPLVVLMRKEKEQKDEAKSQKPDTTESSERQTEPSNTDQVQDTAMTEGSTEVGAEGTTAIEALSGEATASMKDEENEVSKNEEPKPKKSFEPPVIPTRNLQLIANIFIASECGNDTFHATLDTMSSISCVPGTSEVFGKQLIGHVKNLSSSLCSSLDELIPQLREAQASTDLHGITSTRFSHSGSDQVKLLHVLKALDYLSEPKKEGEGEEGAVKSILTTSYEGLSLGPLWSKLSECLSVMGEKDNVIAFASILLPLIESLMVVCKNTSLKEAPLVQQIREEGPTTPIVEDLNDLEQLFFNFTTEHRKILNDIIRQSPKLMQGNGSFSLLVKNPKVLDFDNKRAFFTKQIHSRLHQQRHVQPPLQLNVRRDQVFQDSYKALYFKTADEMKYGKLNIRFNGEEGVDAGGVTREWFQVLARGIFNPDWALWQPVASDKTTFHPNPLSWINGEHLVYFKFIGRIIGKALHEGRVLDCHFSRAAYKRMLGKQPNLKDLESMDLDYYKSLLWILENDITDILTEDFSIVEEQFGEEKIVDLIPDGRNIPVTEENKREYVQKLVEYRLTGSVSEQLEHFIRGFHDIIPAELVAIFDEQELELLISGLPEIDVDDWKANTDYHNYNANSPQITWFWRIVRAMSNEERAKLLQFITGTSKVPLNGFKDLEGMQGTTRFSVHREPNLNRLPTSHTCFNQLDLPAYDNQESLKTNIMKAINLGADYFGFA